MIYGKRGVSSGFLLPSRASSVLAVLRTLPATPADPWRWALVPIRDGIESDPIPCFGARARATFHGVKIDAVKLTHPDAGATFDVWWATEPDDELDAIAPAPSPIILARLSAAAGAAIPLTVLDTRGVSALTVAIYNTDTVTRTVVVDAADEAGAFLATLASAGPTAGAAAIVAIAPGLAAGSVPPKTRIQSAANAGAGTLTITVYGVPA